MDNRNESLLQSLTSKGDQVPLKGILRGEAAAQVHSTMDAFAFPEFAVQGRVPIAKPMSEAEKHVREMEARIADMEKQFSQFKVDAQKQAERAEAKGKAEGLAQGIKEGESKASLTHAQQVETLRKEVAGILQSVHNAYTERVAEIEQQSFELALGIARKLWSREAEIHPERIASIMAEAFQHLGQAETVVVKLHPLDIEVAKQTESLWHPVNSSLRNIQLESDPRMERGGCWVESAGGGTVDLRLQETWDRLEGALRQNATQNVDEE